MNCIEILNKIILPLLSVAIISIQIFVNSNNLIKTFKDTNKPFLSMQKDYNFTLKDEIDVNDDNDYYIDISNTDLIKIHNKQLNNLNKKLFCFDFRLKNIGKGLLKNLSLYSVNSRNEIKIYNKYDKKYNNEYIEHSLILDKDDTIKIEALINEQLTNNNYFDFLGLLFYQDINNELYGALIDFEVLNDINNNPLVTVYFYDMDMKGYTNRILNIITQLCKRHYYAKDDRNLSKEIGVLIQNISKIIHNKKNEISENSKIIETYNLSIK